MSQVTAETGLPIAGQETIAQPRALQWLRPVQLAGPFVVALLVGAVVLLASGRDAAGTYWLLLQQSLGGTTQIANTLVAATPVLLTGLATAIAFRSGIFNVGVEGSLYLGAFAAAWAGFTFTTLAGPALIMLAVVLAGAAGALWGLVPAILRVRWRVDEVVTTLMLNYVAILLTSWLVNYFFLAPDIANSMSRLIANQARLGPLLPATQLTMSFIAAIVITLLYAYLFGRTTLGYELRMTGLNPRFARAVGIDPARTLLVAFLLSGLIGGIAGGFQILGVNYRFIDHFSPGYGFTGIAVALLGRGHPVGILLSALFFGALASGGAMIQLFSDIPLDLINILQGTVMIFAVIELSRLPFVRRLVQHA
jgi:simple sugar transport system permease protein